MEKGDGYMKKTLIANDLYNSVKDVYKPVIKFNDNVYYYTEDSVDQKMIARIKTMCIEDQESYKVVFDLNGYENHNKSVALVDWKDENGELTLTWFETKWYPNNGIITFYVGNNDECPFEIVEENSLFGEYVSLNLNISYIEWLESKVIKLQ